MRYITTQLNWRTDRRFDNHWWSDFGQMQGTFLSFGSLHGWQTSSASARIIATEPFEIEQARVWAMRGELVSLIKPEGLHVQFLSALLQCPSNTWEQPSNAGQVNLGKGDFILRAYFSDALCDRLIQLARRHTENASATAASPSPDAAFDPASSRTLPITGSCGKECHTCPARTACRPTASPAVGQHAHRKQPDLVVISDAASARSRTPSPGSDLAVLPQLPSELLAELVREVEDTDEVRWYLHFLHEMPAGGLRQMESSVVE